LPEPFQIWNAVQGAEVREDPVETDGFWDIGPHVRLFALDRLTRLLPQLRDHLSRDIDCRHVDATLREVNCVLPRAAPQVKETHSTGKEAVCNVPDFRADLGIGKNLIVDRGVPIKCLAYRIHGVESNYKKQFKQTAG